MTEDLLVVMFFTLGLPLSWMFGVTYYRRWKRRLDREELPPPQWSSEVEELRDRVSELEERADFAERLLASRESERLSGGSR